MRVIFLDVDGVLNSYDFFAKCRDDLSNLCEIDLAAVKLIQHAVEATRAIVILSSTWRLDRSLIHQLIDRGVPIDGMTPRLDSFDIRGHEIQAWLDEHPHVTHYAVVDDEADAGIGHESSFVHTDPQIGLTPRDVAKIIGLLT